ncbi:MAG: methionine synthase [Bacteroidales bacterium]|nr:methionine synthase [Bacteroidales bacterium]
MTEIKNLLSKRILILDGAMGTMIQSYKLGEKEYRGARFSTFPKALKGHNDLLCLTCPDIIMNIHEAYLSAGSDIIETNTFNANAVSLNDYEMSHLAYEINFEGANIAKKAAAKFSTSAKPRLVAGSIGPTNKTASISPDVNNPAYRDITFDVLVQAYYEQAKGLIDGGCDILLVETIFDTLNAKAALFAIQNLCRDYGKDFPIMVSATISDMSGRTFTGQTLEALYASLSHVPLLSFGFNCAFGAEQLLPFIKELNKICEFSISVHPNAGLPNELGNYSQDAARMANLMKEFCSQKLVNIIGGCCGTTPDHIRAIADMSKNQMPRPFTKIEPITRISGLEPLHIIKENNFITIGERANVAGSRLFARLLKEKKYDDVMHEIRKQIEAGAQVIDLCVDDPLIDQKHEIVTLLNLMASEPDIAKVPVMIDSSDFNVITEALKCLQGKAVVNSISLKDGEKVFLERAQLVKNFGAALVVMLFDEKGQADTFERKIEIAARAYKLLTEKVNYNPEDIIFDPNIMAIGTGIPEHANYAVDFIEASRWIKLNLPFCKISGGISNLSFAFRGNDKLRQAIHSVFLFHAINAGLDMGIVNPDHDMDYTALNNNIRETIENLVLNRTPDAIDKVLNLRFDDKIVSPDTTETVDKNAIPVSERLQQCLISGNEENLEAYIHECLPLYSNPLDIIEKVLLSAMDIVGERFGTGKMFLPQVIKSARIMKKSVNLLQPYIDGGNSVKSNRRARVLLATVKGDVHDIGKNIVGLVLACNSFEIIDLGVMVSAETILQEVMTQKADIIALSGLITPSLSEMAVVADALEKANLKIPLLIGGAATSELHTALKIDVLYSGPVIHVKDASSCVNIAIKLTDITQNQNFTNSIKENYRDIRFNYAEKILKPLLPLAVARNNKASVDFSGFNTSEVVKTGNVYYSDFPVQQLYYLFDWDAFVKSWDLKINNNTVQNKAIGELIDDTRKMMIDIVKYDLLSANGAVGVYSAFSKDEDVFLVDSKNGNIIEKIPFLRNQTSSEQKRNYCLADFIAPENSEEDFLGMFALSVDLKNTHIFNDDPYALLLLRTVATHLAEAFSAYLHENIWSMYFRDSTSEQMMENVSRDKLINGIRPAIGYPSCPDHSLKSVVLEKLNAYEKCGITLTESYAMLPEAAVCGFYFFNQQSQYFNVGRIDNDQFDSYAKRRGIDTNVLKKILKNTNE